MTDRYMTECPVDPVIPRALHRSVAMAKSFARAQALAVQTPVDVYVRHKTGDYLLGTVVPNGTWSDV